MSDGLHQRAPYDATTACLWKQCLQNRRDHPYIIYPAGRASVEEAGADSFLYEGYRICKVTLDLPYTSIPACSQTNHQIMRPVFHMPKINSSQRFTSIRTLPVSQSRICSLNPPSHAAPTQTVATPSISRAVSSTASGHTLTITSHIRLSCFLTKAASPPLTSST